MLRWRNGSQVALNFRGRDRQDLLRRVHDDDARERRRIRNGQRGSGGSSLLGPLLLIGARHVAAQVPGAGPHEACLREEEKSPLRSCIA